MLSLSEGGRSPHVHAFDPSLFGIANLHMLSEAKLLRARESGSLTGAPSATDEPGAATAAPTSAANGSGSRHLPPPRKQQQKQESHQRGEHKQQDELWPEHASHGDVDVDADLNERENEHRDYYREHGAWQEEESDEQLLVDEAQLADPLPGLAWSTQAVGRRNFFDGPLEGQGSEEFVDDDLQAQHHKQQSRWAAEESGGPLHTNHPPGSPPVPRGRPFPPPHHQQQNRHPVTQRPTARLPPPRPFHQQQQQLQQQQPPTRPSPAQPRSTEGAPRFAAEPRQQLQQQQQRPRPGLPAPTASTQRRPPPGAPSPSPGSRAAPTAAVSGPLRRSQRELTAEDLATLRMAKKLKKQGYDIAEFDIYSDPEIVAFEVNRVLLELEEQDFVNSEKARYDLWPTLAEFGLALLNMPDVAEQVRHHADKFLREHTRDLERQFRHSGHQPPSFSPQQFMLGGLTDLFKATVRAYNSRNSTRGRSEAAAVAAAAGGASSQWGSFAPAGGFRAPPPGAASAEPAQQQNQQSQGPLQRVGSFFKKLPQLLGAQAAPHASNVSQVPFASTTAGPRTTQVYEPWMQPMLDPFVAAAAGGVVGTAAMDPFYYMQHGSSSFAMQSPPPVPAPAPPPRPAPSQQQVGQRAPGPAQQQRHHQHQQQPSATSNKPVSGSAPTTVEKSAVAVSPRGGPAETKRTPAQSPPTPSPNKASRGTKIKPTPALAPPTNNSTGGGISTNQTAAVTVVSLRAALPRAPRVALAPEVAAAKAAAATATAASSSSSSSSSVANATSGSLTPVPPLSPTLTDL